MAKRVFITRKIPEVGINMLREKGYEVEINQKDRPLSKKELIKILSKGNYTAVLSLLTDTIDSEVFEAAPTVKIFANYAIGFNNFNIEDARKRNVSLSNTPGGGAERVAEHTWALILALSCRVVEGDAYMRKGKYKGWDPMLLPGTDLADKTLGIIGTGRIGADVAHRAINGFGMKVVYFDIKRNEELERDHGAQFFASVEEVLKISDVVSLHVPLTPQTTHLINADRLKVMKKTAFLINTSRGLVIDEIALVEALRSGTIAGAGLDVYECEPKIAPGLVKLSNVVLTPHIASATEKSRIEMATTAANNIIDVLEGGIARNAVYN